MKTNNASVKPEVLTDGSIVFNVIRDGEEIAAPESQFEAERICARFNENDCSGVFDGNQVVSDADPGL